MKNVLTTQLKMSLNIWKLFDIDMIRQSLSWFVSAGISFQSSAENLQPYQILHEDGNSIDTVSDHVVDLDKFKNPGTGQFYLDPIVTYMEKFFTAEPQSRSGITLVLQDCRGLYCKDHILNQSLTLLQALVLMPY
jgi:hypothetical protein